MCNTPMHTYLLYTPISYVIKNIIFISDDSKIFFFQGDYEHSKGQTRGKPIHVCRDVQTSVQGDGKRNGHNCKAGGAIPTTLCIRGM
jgi:hypothetical protein